MSLEIAFSPQKLSSDRDLEKNRFYIYEEELVLSLDLSIFFNDL
jgi:hypothetical protein